MKRRLVDWIIATRPWAFSASVVPIAAVAAWLGCRFTGCDWTNVALSLAVLVLMQAGTDVLSDCKDHERGVDYPGSPNGVTWIREGLFTLGELRRLGWALLAAGTLFGCVVVWRSTWNAIWIGVVGLCVAAGYSFLKYRALGDMAVFLAFTALPSVGLGLVSVGRLLPETLLVALPPGLLTMAILNANNIRDVETDARANCRTAPIVLGIRAAKAAYWAQTFLPYLLVAVFIFAGLAPYASVGTFLTLPLAIRNVAALRRNDTAGLDRLSAQLQLLFGVLFAASFPIGLLDFWWQMSIASLAEVVAVVSWRRWREEVEVEMRWRKEVEVDNGGINFPLSTSNLQPQPVLHLFLIGLALAAVLWGVFWLGNAASQWLFGFAREQIDVIYALKAGHSPVVIGLLLLLLIGPAEELFWRGLVQRKLSDRLGANAGFAVATLCYALVHVWSMNFMLVGAAAVCGAFWGILYRFFPRHLPALAVSHALWDVAAFVLFPL